MYSKQANKHTANASTSTTADYVQEQCSELLHDQVLLQQKAFDGVRGMALVRMVQQAHVDTQDIVGARYDSEVAPRSERNASWDVRLLRYAQREITEAERNKQPRKMKQTSAVARTSGAETQTEKCDRWQNTGRMFYYSVVSHIDSHRKLQSQASTHQTLAPSRQFLPEGPLVKRTTPCRVNPVVQILPTANFVAVK